MADPTQTSPNLDPNQNQNQNVTLLPNGGAGYANTTLANNGLSGPATSVTGAQITTPAIASQNSLMQALQAQASGVGGPTLAQNQLQQGLAGNLAGALAASAASRGLQNPGVQNKLLQENLVNANAGATGASAVTRAQQQLTAQQGLAGVQGQSEANAQAQAQLNQQAALANQQAQEAYNAQVYGLTQTNQQNSNTMEQNLTNPATYGQLLSSGAQTGATIGKLSDETAKEDIKDAGAEASRFLDPLKPKSFRYKDPTVAGADKGTVHGIMAQALQKSESGSSMVNKGSDGLLRVDTEKLTMALAGAAGHLHDRVKKLESALKSKKSKRS